MCGEDIIVSYGDGFCSNRCREDYLYKMHQKNNEERRRKEEQRKAEESLARQQREHEERLARQQREPEERLACQLREAEERAIAREKERERRADPQRWYGREWVEHLKYHPEDARECRWEVLTAEDIVILLEREPEFVDQCNLKLLKPADWADLIGKRPEFAELCDCWESVPQKDFVKLLLHNSDLDRYCSAKKWRSFSGSQIADLLIARQQFATNIENWNALSADDWFKVLQMRPELVVHCDLSELDKAKKQQLATTVKVDWPWEALDGVMWSALLSVHPEKANFCNWATLSASDWRQLLEVQPRFFANCSEWKVLSPKLLISLLRKYAKSEPNDIESLRFSEWFDSQSITNISVDDRVGLVSAGCAWMTAMHCAKLMYGLSQLGGVPQKSEMELTQALSKRFSPDDWVVFFSNCRETRLGFMFKLLDDNKLQELPVDRLMPIIVKRPNVVKNFPWEKMLERLSNFDWESLPEDDRVEFAIDVDCCSEMALAGGFNPYALSPRILFWAMDKWPDKFKSFDADSYDWSQCDKDPTLWARFTFFYPQFKKYCNPANVNWHLLDMQDDMKFWAWALAGCPEEVISCFHKWEKIKEDWWPRLIERRPCLAEYRHRYCTPAKPMISGSSPSEEIEKSKSGKDSSPKGHSAKLPDAIKKYWMPALAVLLMLSAFDEGGVASFIIGAGLGVFWLWRKRKAK